MMHPDVKRTLDSFLPERNENFQTMEIKPGWEPSGPQTLPWDGKRGELQTLPYRPTDNSSGLVAPMDRHWGGGLGHYPRPKPEGFPPIGLPPGGSGGGWKMECKPVSSTPTRPTWPGLGVPGNI
tara:strand:- start:396 stop:767 length:372 start_codon:yes stop_codon:yes gene_type:complete